MRCIFFIITLSLNPFVFADDCIRWFDNAKIKKDKDCILKCSTIGVGMGTFGCSSKCDKLCKIPKKNNLLFNLSKLYPGLTESEHDLVSKYPGRMYNSYIASWNAESLCARLYSESTINDESDACRHYVWAVLLYKKFGNEFSTKVLDAHEQDDKQSEIEKRMDLTNNKFGQAGAKRLIKENKFTNDEILKSFKNDLKNKKLIIIKSGEVSKK